MTCSCCGPPSGTAEKAVCPQDGSVGDPVKRLTVAAQMRGAIPPMQGWWMCRGPGCKVVYFGSAGSTVTVDEGHEIPSFKEQGSGVACYCFGHSKSRIIEEVRASGTSSTATSVEEEVRAGNCACEVRNPSGKCCLQDLIALVERTRRAQERQP